MSVATIRLDAVRSARPAVASALAAELRRAGWELGEPGPTDDERTIGLADVGGWIVIDDPDGEDSENWSEHIAGALDTGGVRMRGSPDFGRLYVRRWNGRKVAGTIDAIVRPKKVVDASFLGDLATTKRSRDALSKVSLSGGVGAALDAISRHASLPSPLGDRELVPVEELRLKKPFEKSLFAHDPRTRNVAFEESIHLRGFKGRDVMVLVASALKSKGRVPSPSGGRGRRFFIHESSGWVTFGEVQGDDPLRVRWPKVLARELRTPVLVVRTIEKVDAELELWTDAAEPTTRTLPRDINRLSAGELELDVRWLSPLLGAGAEMPVVVGAAVGPLSFVGESRTVVWGIAERLALPNPILEGRYRGTEVSFRTPADRQKRTRLRSGTLH